MAEHPGQVGLITEERQDATRQIDVAAWNSERIDRGRVDHGEAPRQVGTVRARGHPEPDLADVLLQLVVVVQPHLAAYLLVGLTPQRDLLGLRHHDELARPGDWIPGAAGQPQHGERQNEAPIGHAHDERGRLRRVRRT